MYPFVLHVPILILATPLAIPLATHPLVLIAVLLSAIVFPLELQAPLDSECLAGVVPE